MIMLDFICIGSAELFGTGRERKIQNENMSPVGFELTPGTPLQVYQRFRPLGHDGLTMNCCLMSFRVMGYKQQT